MPEAVAMRPRKSRHAPGRAMISSERISKRVRQLGHDISEVYADIDTPLVIVAILKGATVFSADLLVEDIVDAGRTIVTIQRRFRKMKPASLRVAALLDRPARREFPVHIDFTGFVIPDRFVIGYGLDYAGLYRELPGIYALS